MDKQMLYFLPIAKACGAAGHHDFFLRNTVTRDRIAEMVRYGWTNGLKALLRREYPLNDGKNIIVNLVDNKPYVIDGNCHCIALLLLDPKMTFGQLEELRPGILRVWKAGVEAGQNSSSNPYDVYIPAEVDISGVPGARRGMDYFKDPPVPTNIVPGNFAADSKLLNENDRGRPLGETADALRKILL